MWGEFKKKVFEWWNYRPAKLQYLSDCMCFSDIGARSSHGIRAFIAVALEVCISQAFSCHRSHLVCCSRQVLVTRRCKSFQIKPWSPPRKHDVQIGSKSFNSETVIANSVLSLWNHVKHLNIISRSLGWHKSVYPPTHAHLCVNMLQDFFPPLSNKGIPHLLMVIQDTDGQASLFFQFLPWLLLPLLGLLVKLKKFHSLVTLLVNFTATGAVIHTCCQFVCIMINHGTLDDPESLPQELQPNVSSCTS